MPPPSLVPRGKVLWETCLFVFFFFSSHADYEKLEPHGMDTWYSGYFDLIIHALLGCWKHQGLSVPSISMTLLNKMLFSITWWCVCWDIYSEYTVTFYNFFLNNNFTSSLCTRWVNCTQSLHCWKGFRLRLMYGSWWCVRFDSAVYICSVKWSKSLPDCFSM